jgi:glucosyl-dolichyl phosphate glucuronosyltransferase
VLDTSNSGVVEVIVILCTYNRGADLARALETIARSEMEDSVRWEVLVVDNNSTDQTRSIVQEFCRRYPGRFRYLFEPTPGKSFALNTAIAQARGRVLAFVDDDVCVEPTWLRNLTAELLRDTCWGGVGGRTLPEQKFTPPSWLSRDMNGWGEVVFAYFDMGDSPGELRRPPYGTNMAFRKSIFEKHGPFRIDLGPIPGSRIRNEDTELGRRLLAAGVRLRYEPSAIVYHPVPHERITKEYFLSWWFDYGRAMIIERGDRPNLCGIPYDYFALLSRFVEISIHAFRGTLALSVPQRFMRRCKISRNKGQVAELYDRLFNSRNAAKQVQLEDRKSVLDLRHIQK